jgi:hypothetical protein
MTATYCGLVGERNSSNVMQIEFLFLSSCYPQKVNINEYATFQSERIKNTAEL